MKILVNLCYGGFTLTNYATKKIAAIIGCEERKVRHGDFDRSDARAIEFLEHYGLDRAQEEYCRLGIIEIPDGATDFVLDENDGYERIIYVVDGKIRYA